MTTITGTPGDDYLLGTSGDDSIYGLDGYDTLDGAEGNDILDGGTDSKGNPGSDWAYYYSAASAVIVNLSTGTATGGAGNDTLISIENIAGSSYADTLTGDANPNALSGSDGDDTLYGDAGSDSLYGDAGADTLYGGADDDALSGGKGNDILDGGTETGSKGTGDIAQYYDAVSAVIVNLSTGTATGGAGNDTLISIESIEGSSYADTLTGNANTNMLRGNDGNDTLYGDAGNDTLYGDAGDDALYGGADDDVLSGGKGNDILDGGTETKGGDSAAYSDAISAVIVNLSTGTATGGAGNDTLISIESIEGSLYADTLTGNANTNTLRGNDGNDTLYGDAGIDTLYGDAGDDVLYGGADSDLLYGGKGNDILDGGTGKSSSDSASYFDAISAVIVNLSTGTATGGAGNDTLIDIENITGSSYADTLSGDANSNALSGLDGDDKLYGDAGNDSLYGDAGNDILIGGDGDDTLDGGTETGGKGKGDIAQYYDATSAVIVNLSTGIATGGAGNDTLINIENILGSAYADTLTGDANPNMLDGGAGADSLKGEAGDDSYVVDNTGDIITEKLNEGADQVSSSVTYTLSANVENLSLTGALAINGTGNSLANSITGNTADNVLNGGTGADSLIGGSGNDTYTVDNAGDVVTENLSEGTDKINSNVTYILSPNVENLTLTGTLAINGTGNDLVNTLLGNSAANLLDGGSGADALRGGAGDDTYIVDNAGDVITENLNAGTDKVNSSVTYTIRGNIENLELTGVSAINGTGNTLANTITGNSANNILNGAAGADTLIGGLGNDTYTVDNAGDAVTENLGEGTDKVNSSVTYALSPNVENLTLTGALAINGTGNDLANSITGNAADNELNGGAGNDTLNGGAGTNTLTGGLGKDIFKFNTASHTDTIADFVVVDDTIQLENAVFTALTTTGTLAASNFVIGAAAVDFNDFIIYNSGTGVLFYDADGNGAVAAVQIATLTGGLALTNADFVVI